MVIVVIGEIDISLPAILALGNILFAHFSQSGAPVWLAALAVVAVGIAAGALNGALVVAFGLPSLAVTLGMMGAYRAFALLIGGQEGYAAFDDSYVWLGSAQIGDVMPVSLVLIAIVFALFTFVMHGTVYGRLCYVIGNNARAARLSGVRVALVKVAPSPSAAPPRRSRRWSMSDSTSRPAPTTPATSCCSSSAPSSSAASTSRRPRQRRRRAAGPAAARHAQERHGPRQLSRPGADAGRGHAAGGGGADPAAGRVQPRPAGAPSPPAGARAGRAAALKHPSTPWHSGSHWLCAPSGGALWTRTQEAIRSGIGPRRWPMAG